MIRAFAGSVLLVAALSCTSTAPTITSASSGGSAPLSLQGSRIAVLPFSGAPDRPETGRAARDIAVSILVQRYAVKLVSPSKVDAYLKEKSITPSEFDLEPLTALAATLEADILVWGQVDQFTPYHFDRMAPATPPYVELTLFALPSRASGVKKVGGHKQGALPATIWSRQPTFQDVAQPLIAELISGLAR
ncbi:MAG: hypothetical protein WEB59_06270 [Thermoanaerobaculia bacterium]